MPLYKTIRVNDFTKVFVWKIEESLEDLTVGIELTELSKKRVETMKSVLHQQGFMSVRQLLKQAGYVDADVYYDAFGKPHLKDKNYLSITHSFTFTAIIISEKKPVGIDVEKNRDKIVKIAHKFTPIEEYNTIANHDALVSKLTIVWGAKESLYKIYGKKKLRFLHHIYIEDFSFIDTKTTGVIKYEGHVSTHNIHFLEFEDFTCVYAL
jgi:4'-phosphopantetheinyl transferase